MNVIYRTRYGPERLSSSAVDSFVATHGDSEKKMPTTIARIVQLTLIAIGIYHGGRNKQGCVFCCCAKVERDDDELDESPFPG
jgi:hypothetical protein